MAFTLYKASAPWRGGFESNAINAGTITRAAPTTDAADGVSAAGVKYSQLVYETDAGTITAPSTGVSEFWAFNAEIGFWFPVPALFIDHSTMPLYTASNQRLGFPGIVLPGGFGRYLWRPNAVAVGGGAASMKTHIRGELSPPGLM